MRPPCHDIAEGQLLLVGDCIHSVGAGSSLNRIFTAEAEGYGCPTVQDAQIFRFPSIVNASTFVHDGIWEGSILTLSIAVNASNFASFSEEFRFPLGGGGSLRSFKVERADGGRLNLNPGVLLQSDEHHHILRASTGSFLIESPGGLINFRGGTGVVINSLPADPKLSSAYMSVTMDGSIQIISGERGGGGIKGPNGIRNETNPGIKIASANSGVSSQDVHILCGSANQGNGGNVVIQGGDSDRANGGNITIQGGMGEGHVNIQGGGSTDSKGSGNVYIGTASIATAGMAAGNVTIKAGSGERSQRANGGDVTIYGGGAGGAWLHLAGECTIGVDRDSSRSCSSGSAKLKSFENMILYSEAGSIELAAANRTTIVAKEGVEVDARYGRVQLLARNLSIDTDSITMMAKHEALLSSNKRVTAGVLYNDGNNPIQSSTVELSRNGVIHATTGTWEVEARRRVTLITSAGEKSQQTHMPHNGKTLTHYGTQVLLDQGCASVTASADINISAATTVSLHAGTRNESTVNITGGKDPTIQIVAPHVTVQASGVGSFCGNDISSSESALAELKLKEGRSLLVGTQYSALETSSMTGRIRRVTTHGIDGVSLLSSESTTGKVESHLTLLDGDVNVSATKSVHIESNSTQLAINGGGIRGFGAGISLESKSDGTVLASATYVTTTSPLIELATLHGKSRLTLNSTLVSASSPGALKMLATNYAPRSIASELNLESGSASTASLSSRTVNVTGGESILLHGGMGGITIETSSNSKLPTIHPYKRARGISFVPTKEQGVGVGPSFSLAVGAKPSALLHVSDALNISESSIPSGALLALESPVGAAEMFISSNNKHASIIHFGPNKRPSSASIVVRGIEQSQFGDNTGSTRPSSTARETLMTVGPDAGSRIVLRSNGEAGVGKVCDSDTACIPMAGWHIFSPESVARSGKPSLLVESSSGLNIVEIQGYNRNPQAAVNIIRLTNRRGPSSPVEQYWSIVHQPGSLIFTHMEGTTDSPTEMQQDSIRNLVRFTATNSNGRGSVMIGPPASSPSSSSARLVVGGVVLAEEMLLYADAAVVRDVEPVNSRSSIERLLKLQVVNYGWKNEDSSKLGLASGVRQIGILAQGAEKVVPEIVWRDKSNGGQRAVSASRLTFLTVSGLQNVAVSVDELKTGQLERDKEVAEARKAQAEVQLRTYHLEERFSENLKRISTLENEKEAMYATINAQETEIRLLQKSLENTLEKISSLQTAVSELENSIKPLVELSAFDVREDEAYFLKMVDEIENDTQNEALESGKTIEQAIDYLQKREASTLNSALKRLKRRQNYLTAMRKYEGRVK